MNERLIKIAEKIKTDEPFENKEWLELSFNYGVWVDGEYNEFAIEWVASHIFGENRDNISHQSNFFGKTPDEALSKLEESLTQ